MSFVTDILSASLRQTQADIDALRMTITDTSQALDVANAQLEMKENIAKQISGAIDTLGGSKTDVKALT